MLALLSVYNVGEGGYHVAGCVGKRRGAGGDKLTKARVAWDRLRRANDGLDSGFLGVYHNIRQPPFIRGRLGFYTDKVQDGNNATKGIQLPGINETVGAPPFTPIPGQCCLHIDAML